MISDNIIKPDFLIIGAQKSATTWLWNMLKQHPGTSLPDEKEIHFFGSAELYRKGKGWYFNHFKRLDPSKVVGEGSTTYLYDHLPFWYNKTDTLEHDFSLPTIPELITKELPHVKVVVILRDPVKRAVSAYKHLIRHRLISPMTGLRKAALRYPKKRLIEYGYYDRYIILWQKFLQPERMRILVFEEDIAKQPEETLRDIYGFLNLDTRFMPSNLQKRVYRGMGWSELLLAYYSHNRLNGIIGNQLVLRFLNRVGLLLDPLFVKKKDIELFRSVFLPRKKKIEALLGRNLDCWDYDYKRKFSGLRNSLLMKLIFVLSFMHYISILNI